MRQVTIRLTSSDQVQFFVKTLTMLNGNFEIISSRHILDARSLMGIFSLVLSRPILLKVYNDCTENLDALTPYLSEEATHHR